MKSKKFRLLDTLQKLGGILIVVFSIFAVLLPIAGFSLNMGYLSVFGIDNDSFPRSLVDLWQYSYIVTFKWLAFVIKPYLYIICSVAIVIGILMLFGFVIAILRTVGKIPLSSEKYEKVFGKKSIFGKFDLFIESFNMILKELKVITYTFLLLVFVPLSIYFLLIDPFQAGQEFARKDFDRYQGSGCVALGWSRCVEYSNRNNPDDVSYSGLLVAASSSHIAIFGGSSVSIIPRKPEYILVKTYTPKEKEKPEKAE